MPPETTQTAADHLPPGFLPWVAALVHEHRGRLLAYARRRGLDAEEALDAVQDCFVSFLGLPEARAIADHPADAIRLLTVVLRHHIANRRRKTARHARAHRILELAADETGRETSEHLVARAEEIGRLRGCLVRMAGLQRHVVMLSLIDDRPRDEVARLLGISGAHVRVLVHRARQHLRRCTYASDDQIAAGAA